MSRRFVNRLLHRTSDRIPLSRRDLLKLGGVFAAGLLSSGTGWSAAAARRRVIVVGAGFAGLACAHELRAIGYDVTVLEARNRVSGRVTTLRDFVSGCTVEGGGELIGTNHPTWLAYANRFGLTLKDMYETPEGFSEPLLVGGKPLRREEFDQADEELGQLEQTMTKDARKVHVDEPWKGPQAEAWDRLSTRAWLQSQPVGSLTKALMDFTFAGDNGASTDRQSYLGNLAQVAGGGHERYWDETEVLRCVGGNAQLAGKFAEQLGDRVQLGRPVVRIEHSDDGVSVVDASGTTWTADDVVLATPPSVWRKIEIKPRLPAALQPQMGIAVKYLAVVSGRFWETVKLSPYATTDGPISMTWEGTDGQELGSRGEAVLTSFSGGDAARACRAVIGTARSELYAAELEALYPGFRQSFLRDAFMDWPGDPWSQGSYSFPDCGQVTAHGPLLRAGLGRLHFAGEHTCFKFVGYMEGALTSGNEVATRLAVRDGLAKM